MSAAAPNLPAPIAQALAPFAPPTSRMTPSTYEVAVHNAMRHLTDLVRQLGVAETGVRIDDFPPFRDDINEAVNEVRKTLADWADFLGGDGKYICLDDALGDALWQRAGQQDVNAGHLFPWEVE